MKKKVAIALCAHHKPWLMMSTLITTLAQGVKDIDFIIIYQKGDGSCPDKAEYNEYRKIAAKCEINPQLSDEDLRVKDICAIKGFNIRELEFENDHALDSGAWYKLIREGSWKDYDYVFCIQEGNLFTGDNVLKATLEFVQKNDVHFLSSGHEKQKLPKSLVKKYNTRGPNPNAMDYYHDARMQETFDIFCTDADFKKLYDDWGDTEMITQNLIPDILVDPFWFRVRQIARAIKRKGDFPVFRRTICENTYRRSLDKVVGNYHVYDNIIFNKENGPEWFGCSCQHFFSRQFLQKFSRKLEENNLYRVIKPAYSGSSLEIVWGFLPAWLGYDKWFFDGIHRVRKNFVTYKREDDCVGMCHYINKYFREKIHVIADGAYVRIDRMHKKFNYLKDMLPSQYFADK